MDAQTDKIRDLRQSLKNSITNRAAMIKKYGFVPLSILRFSSGRTARNLFIYQHDAPERNAKNLPRHVEKLEALKKAGYKFASPSSKMAGRGTLATTIMSPELVEFFIKYYTHAGDVYIDPFAGQGVQLQVAHYMHMDYYGYDLSEEFAEYINAITKHIDDKTSVIRFTQADSRYPVNIPDNIGDFCFTSPPYWDIEFYGTESGQLGYNTSYPQFLEGMEEIAKAWLPKFKKNATIIINVNDFRKEGVFYPYHSDTIQLFTKAGYVITDVWIIEGTVGGIPKAFAVDFNSKHIAPKVHEYALVFKKL